VPFTISAAAMKVMLDTNAIDRLSEDQEFVVLLKDLIAADAMHLFITSVLKNQIADIPGEAKRSQFFQILDILKTESIPVELAPYGWAYGECYGGVSPDISLDHEHFIGGKNSEIPDAMIAATASSKKYNLDFVVTNDEDFIKKLNRQGLHSKAIRFHQFKVVAAQLHITGGHPTLVHL
jgi:rRNA-processing protein FCF1